MIELNTPIHGLNAVLKKGENISQGFQLITPNVISKLSSPEIGLVTTAISQVIKSRYHDSYGDETVYNHDSLEAQIATGDISKMPDSMKYFFG